MSDKVTRYVLRTLATFAMLSLWLPSAHAAESDQWRIHVGNDAVASGELMFRFHPRGAYPFDVGVSVAAETGENDIARRIREVFLAELPPGYKVEVDDGEEVVVEARDGTGVFSLVLLESSLAGVEFEVEKD